MRRWLFGTIVTTVLASSAWAQGGLGLRFGQEGSMGAFTGHMGKMLTDPIYMLFVVIALLVMSRMFHWGLLPAGGVVGALAIMTSAFFTARYPNYYLGTGPFWAAAVALGLLIGLVVVVGLGMMGKKE